MTRLRRHGPTTLLAILLLVFQVVLSADHLGATVARMFTPAGDDVVLGLLSLCHGDGSLTLRSDADDPAPQPPAPPCVLCTVATLAANGLVGAPPVLALPDALPLTDLPIAVSEAPPVRSPLRYGTQRGPPVLLVV